jgi:HD-like signal output (HDOD) protein
MSPLDYLISFLLATAIIYLVLMLCRTKEKPPPAQRVIRRQPAQKEVGKEAASIEAGEVQKPVGQPVELHSELEWRPLSRPQVEVETIWRLEHTLRELPEMGDAPMVQIDYSMEPRELAMVLASNPLYAAKILKTVNSAAFGLRYRIDSLQRAITYLGYNQVKNIVCQQVMRSKLHEVQAESENFDLIGFWKHSHAVSVCAEYILREVLHHSRNSGVITTAALMHDIGWVVFGHYDSQTAAGFYKRLLDESDIENPMEVEEEIFGFNHQVAGRMLAEEWKIPKAICELIDNHHCGTFGFEGDVDRDTAFGACVIAMAEQLTAQMGFSHPLAEPHRIAVDISKILGPQAKEIKPGSVKLREELDKTMKFIEEFNRAE